MNTKTKKIEKFANDFVEPLLSLIDKNFFICIEGTDGREHALAAMPDEIKKFSEMIIGIKETANSIESGSIIYDAQGLNGIEIARKYKDMASVGECILQLVKVRKNQIKNAFDYEKKRQNRIKVLKELGII